MLLKYVCLLLVRAWWTAGEVGQGGGWLDRVVYYHRNKFIQDLKENSVQINATIEQAPHGYTDSPAWDEESVLRLVRLIHTSQHTAPVRQVLRRALRPTRRLYYSKKESYKIFPSLSKDHPNYFYYDSGLESEEMEGGMNAPGGPFSGQSGGHFGGQFGGQPGGLHSGQHFGGHHGGFNGFMPIPGHEKIGGFVAENAVVVVRNPVEARLPSARISVQLLRSIMEARAVAGRKMPTTVKHTQTWLPRFNTTQSKQNTTTEGATTIGEDEGEAEDATDDVTDEADEATEADAGETPEASATAVAA